MLHFKTYLTLGMAGQCYQRHVQQTWAVSLDNRFKLLWWVQPDGKAFRDQMCQQEPKERRRRRFPVVPSADPEQVNLHAMGHNGSIEVPRQRCITSRMVVVRMVQKDGPDTGGNPSSAFRIGLANDGSPVSIRMLLSSRVIRYTLVAFRAAQ